MSSSLHGKNNVGWIKPIARLGFFAKGVIYFSVGLLAFKIAVGIGGQTSGATKILKQFVYKPFGQVLLILALAGLLLHAFWKFCNGFWDVENNGTDFSGIFFRVIEVIVGFLYLALGYGVIQILLGKGAKSSTQTTQIWVAKVLSWPFGKWIVWGAALVTFIMGCFQFYSVYSARFDDHLGYQKINDEKRFLVRGLGRIGLIAWAIVYFMMSFLFIQAARFGDPKKAGGLGRALSALSKKPYGAWVLGVTSAGLIIYGLYLFVHAWLYKLDK